MSREEFIRLWGPTFANYVYDMAMEEETFPSERTLVAMAIGVMLRRMEKVEHALERIENNDRS